MFFFLISFCSFILLSWKSGMRLLSLPWFWREVSSLLLSWFGKSRFAIDFFRVSIDIPSMNKAACSRVGDLEENEEASCLLDLPELALECILERLSPAELCTMARVCSSLRDVCTSDHLWEKHMKQKWGKLIGDAAYREWKYHNATRKRTTHLDSRKRKGLLRYIPSLWIKPKLRCVIDQGSSLSVDSIMDWYLSLESGRFSFPAQVYNRENGHIGFMLSCYDAAISYDSCTDTFRARYSPLGGHTIEENVEWKRLRAPPVDTPAHVLHVSDCLNDLKPGDHIEIQWRRNKEFPYGWWYGVVGHLDSCSGNIIHCRCHSSDTVILEFKQYTPASRWSLAVINRKDHREVGNEVDGFYGGIRKLYREEDISMWLHLQPLSVLE
ncbi:F-box protein At2g26850-like isoform X2 [Cornus florida]|uniref:F-box protein At2g26850-like isoform X2 n=1 Tax=Cornus florida TaxID=4283 RepID=UPI00289976C4|nr:F-box protein At2g26850-like isoform X2 [Cornus florida]